MDYKNIKKKFFSRWLFEIIHIICFEIWDLRSKDLKIFLGHDVNYLSIWPFMRHPWFPTRKASKLTFTCFQLAGWWPCDCFQLAGLCHSPASWKHTNISFEALWQQWYRMDTAWCNHNPKDGNVGTETLVRLGKIVKATRVAVDGVLQVSGPALEAK